jgi:N-methylhydantoinase A
MSYYVGTDIGGTFTDCVVLDEAGNITVSKSPSTPPDFAEGLMNSLLDAAAQLDLALPALLKRTRLFSHGCTVATNTLINQSGAKVGVITTKGFEETLYIMRGSAYCQGLPVSDWYHKPQNERPFDLVPLSRIVAVTERVDRMGEVIVALNEDEVKRAAEFLVRVHKCQAITVAFLWSFANPAHENRAKEIIEQEFPDICVNTSAEVVALIGEYERFSTAVLNCYLRPEVDKYVYDLSSRLSEKELTAPFLIMQAHGGLTPWESAARRAVAMLQSGPTGGVIAGKAVGSLVYSENIITADMGGTSFDISLIAEGKLRYATKSYHSRHVVAAPMVDIESIGAGGGSIAYVDRSVCKVGPQSAGAEPGPVCYSRGGSRPTVTDANLVLGYLNPDFFLGGKMRLDIDAARDAVKREIADPLGLDVTEAAYGIHRIVNAHMSDALRFHVLHRGYDPRDFDLLLFGGATPIHAIGIGEDLEVRSIIIPLAGIATVLSAFGIVNTDVVRTYSASMSLPLEPDSMETLETQYRVLEEQGLAELAADGFRKAEVKLERIANIRYHLQLTEVAIELSGEPLTREGTDDIIHRFDRRYAELYGENAGFKEAGRDIISQFVRAIAKTPKVKLKPGEEKPHGLRPVRKGTRDVCFDGANFMPADIYDGDLLPAYSKAPGPAVLEMVGTTVLVPPGYRAEFDAYRNIFLRKEE